MSVTDVDVLTTVPISSLLMYHSPMHKKHLLLIYKQASIGKGQIFKVNISYCLLYNFQCRQITVKRCKCGQKEKEVQCCKDFQCETKCNKMRDCGKHMCKRKVMYA